MPTQFERQPRPVIDGQMASLGTGYSSHARGRVEKADEDGHKGRRDLSDERRSDAEDECLLP